MLRIAVLAVCLLVTACGGKKTSSQKSDPDANQPAAALFTVSDNQLQRLKIVPARTATFPISVHTTGTVDWDADHTAPAIAQVGGPVSRIVVDTGSRVKAGDPLLYVSSTDASNAIVVYRKAKNDEDLARRNMERSKDLLDHGAIARQDFEAAQSAFNDAAADVQNSLQSLRIYGLSEKDINEAQQQGVPVRPEIALRSPISGVVVQKTVSPGQLVQAAATTCFLLSDTSTVWILGHVFDHDLPAVHIGDPVQASNPSFAQPFGGRVSYIDALVDPDTRTTLVRVVARNTGLLLKKDMYVNAIIHTRTQRNILTVPVSAVLRDSQNQPIVYVESGSGRFGQRIVEIGAQHEDRVEILGGLKEGENVVSEGTVFLQFASMYH
ncbi:MAG TPA: efflux RND transporter periplasmic adaptor subunit [Bryobacteraceae bacterium]|jgi:cobalt-zinc-cadmium efflux system membrane fusion protein